MFVLQVQPNNSYKRKEFNVQAKEIGSYCLLIGILFSSIFNYGFITY